MKIKKIFTFLIIFALSLFFISSTSKLEVKAAGDLYVTTSGSTDANNQGQYRVVENKATNYLPYGVKHYTDISESTTSYSISKAAGGSGDTNLPFNPGSLYPQQVNVLEVPSTEGVKITSWGNLNNHRWTLTTVKNLIADYEAKNPGWNVIGAINGDFFDIGAKGNLPYQTSGALVSDGNFYKSSSGNFVGFTNDGSADSLVADMKPARTDTMKLAIYNENDEIIKTFNVEKYNAVPAANQTAVYYGTYNSNKDYVPVTVDSGDADGFFVEYAELALPNNASDFYGRGIISSLNDMKLEKGQFGLVTNNQEVKDALAVGVKVRVQWEYKGAASNVDAASGVGETILRDGEYVAGAGSDRHPRTLVGRKADGTLLMVVIDGRQSAKDMYGAHGSEMAAMMRRYGAVEAYNLDGGGSSTLVIKQGDDYVVQNSPSDGWERTDANCLLIVARDPEINVNDINAGEKELEFNVNVEDFAGHDIQELFVNMNGNSVPVVEGKAKFDRLRVDNEYEYKLQYKDKNGKLIDLLTNGTIKTLKYTPKFDKVNVTEDDTSFTLTTDFTDRSLASNFATAPVTINGKKFNFTDSQLVVQKSEVGDKITEILIELNYDLNNDNYFEFNIKNPHYYSTMTLNYLFDDLNNAVNDLYK